MSLVRNFTKRARAQTRGEDQAPPRSCTVKYAPGTINRAKISLPTELLSTTNVQALNAPDIRKISGVSAAGSSTDSLNSDNDFSIFDKGFLSADSSSSASDLSPITPMTPFSDLGISNEIKDFFSAKPVIASAVSTPAPEPVPALPKRAPSHSKKAHVELSQERSVKRSMSPPPTDIARSEATTRDNVAIFSSPNASLSESAHPFSRELAKVDKVAEGFGAAGIVLDEEEQEMLSKGLRKFTVEDYIAEITGFTGGIYEDRIMLNPWL